MDVNQALSAKQHSIIPIAAFTVNGDMECLRTALHEVIDAGLTVNEGVPTSLRSARSTPTAHRGQCPLRLPSRKSRQFQ